MKFVYLLFRRAMLLLITSLLYTLCQEQFFAIKLIFLVINKVSNSRTILNIAVSFFLGPFLLSSLMGFDRHVFYECLDSL